MEENTNEKSRAKLIGFIVKTAVTVALFVFIGALIFRMCQASHKALEDTSISQGFKDAYKISEEVITHAVNDEFSENGAVYAYSLVYMPKANYLQLTVRYNKRHIDEVKLTYPDFNEDDISYCLADGNGKIYIPKVLGKEDKYNYRYFKLEFTGVDFSTSQLDIKMLLNGIDINVGDKSTLTVHRIDDTFIAYQFSSEEKKELNIK